MKKNIILIVLCEAAQALAKTLLDYWNSSRKRRSRRKPRQ